MLPLHEFPKKFCRKITLSPRQKVQARTEANAKALAKSQARVNSWDEIEEFREAHRENPDPNSGVNHELVIRIANGAMFLRKRASALEVLDRDQLLLEIAEHLMKTTRLEDESVVNTPAWLAHYSVEWWKWASTGREKPGL
jgi:hypothetical protein